MSSTDETTFCDIHIPIQDDIISRVMNTFLFDDDSFEDKPFWEEICERIEETDEKDSEEYKAMKKRLENVNYDVFIGGVKSKTENNINYINMLFYARNNREDDESHLRFFRENIVNPFNDITNRKKGEQGIFVHMADTSNRMFVVTDGVTSIDMGE